MGKLLLVDNDPHEATPKRAVLVNAGHSVETVTGDTDGEIHDKVRRLFLAMNDATPKEDAYDVLLLDIYFRTALGGVDLYNKLVDGGFRAHWKHTIIWSRYASSTIRSADRVRDSIEFGIRIFVETAGIPTENIVLAQSRSENVLRRIAELLVEPAPVCRVCGRSLNPR